MPWGRHLGGFPARSSWGGGVPCQVQPGWGVPCQVQGGTLPGPARGVPCQVQPGGYPARSSWGDPARSSQGRVTLPGGVPCRGGTQLGQHREYLLHGGRYASCVHAGGLSCSGSIANLSHVIQFFTHDGYTVESISLKPYTKR